MFFDSNESHRPATEDLFILHVHHTEQKAGLGDTFTWAEQQSIRSEGGIKGAGLKNMGLPEYPES